jgi:hypothetical protein
MSNKLESFYYQHISLFEELKKNNLYIYRKINDYSCEEKIYIEFKSKYINKTYKTVNNCTMELINYYRSTDKHIVDYIERILFLMELEIIQDIQKTNRTFIFHNELPFKTWKKYIK